MGEKSTQKSINRNELDPHNENFFESEENIFLNEINNNNNRLQGNHFNNFSNINNLNNILKHESARKSYTNMRRSLDFNSSLRKNFNNFNLSENHFENIRSFEDHNSRSK